jgi:hypothetical protein
VFWPIHLFSDESTIDYVTRDRAFMHSLHPEHEGVWTVEIPGFSKRQLTLRLEGDNDWAPEADPTFYGWATYGLDLQADQPFWRDVEPVTREFEAYTPVDFYSEPFLYLGQSNSLATASVVNPGDVEAWPVVVLRGPFTNATVTIAGQVIEVPFSLASGKSLTLDYDPDAETPVLDSDGNDRYEDLGEVAWGAIEPGVDVPLGLDITGSGGSATVSFYPLYLRAW